MRDLSLWLERRPMRRLSPYYYGYDQRTGAFPRRLELFVTQRHWLALVHSNSSEACRSSSYFSIQSFDCGPHSLSGSSSAQSFLYHLVVHCRGQKQPLGSNLRSESTMSCRRPYPSFAFLRFSWRYLINPPFDRLVLWILVSFLLQPPRAVDRPPFYTVIWFRNLLTIV